jgi:hypothetical protein
VRFISTRVSAVIIARPSSVSRAASRRACSRAYATRSAIMCSHGPSLMPLRRNTLHVQLAAVVRASRSMVKLGWNVRCAF